MLLTQHINPKEARPLKRAEYDELVRLGAFEQERVELLFGTIVNMSPHGKLHDSSVQRLTRKLARLLVPKLRADVRIRCAFSAADHSEPEPDIAVVPPEDYLDQHPDDAWLIIEVAESSLAKDRSVKAPLYAASGVPEYWIVNLVDNVIEVYTGPEGSTYRQVRTARKGEHIVLQAFPDVTIEVSEVL